MSSFSGLFIPDQQIDLLDMRQDVYSSTFQSIHDVEQHPVLIDGKEGWQVLPKSDRSSGRSETEASEDEPSPYEPAWLRISREELFKTPVRRLCITVPAGVGKTTIVQQLQVMRPQLNPGHLVIKVDLADLHKTDALPANSYLDLQGAEGCFLVQQLFSEINSPEIRDTGLSLDYEKIRSLIRSDIQRGNFTLIVDALDQLSSGPASRVATELNGFLTMYPDINLVVVGRPYAITRLWEKLFKHLTWQGSDPESTAARLKNPLLSSSNEWYFARVNRFSEDQVKRYLGEERFSLIKRLGAGTLFLPRSLNRVRRLSTQELEWVRTASDIYWITVNLTLNDDLRPMDRDSNLVAGVELDPQELLPVLSALAFTAVSWEGGPQTDFFTDGNQLDQFLTKAEEFYKRGNLHNQAEHTFNERIRQLSELNLEAFSMVIDQNNRKHLVKFSDPTLRDFLAAHWVATYAAPDDQGVQQFLRESVAYGEKRDTGRAYYEFWKFLCEMPAKFTRDSGAPSLLKDMPAARNNDSWLAAIAILFQAFTQDEHSIGLRPTEMMYRSLPTLFQLYQTDDGQGLLEPFYRDRKQRKVVRWTEQNLQHACTAAQELARAYVSVPVGIGDAESTPESLPSADPLAGVTLSANKILLEFLTEFPLLYHGVNPAVRQWQDVTGDIAGYQKTLRKFNHDFLPIPPKPADSLKGWFSRENALPN